MKIYKVSGYSDKENSRMLRDYKIESFEVVKENPRGYFVEINERKKLESKRETSNSQIFTDKEKAKKFLKERIIEAIHRLEISFKQFQTYKEYDAGYNELFCITIVAEQVKVEIFTITKETKKYYYIDKQGRNFCKKQLVTTYSQFERWFHKDLIVLRQLVDTSVRTRLSYLNDKLKTI